MNEYTFFYRVKNSDDRDCCAYVSDRVGKFECGHYFARLILQGACYSNSDFEEYDDIDTILSREDYEKLIELNKQILDLGYGIKQDDERYNEGMKINSEMQTILDKLKSDEANDFFEQIKESEDEWIKDEYNLDDDDLEQIWDAYYLDYHDRGCIGCIYQDAEELGEEMFECYRTIDENLKKYIDFEKFGEDLCNDSDCYCVLDDDRIVSLNY